MVILAPGRVARQGIRKLVKAAADMQPVLFPLSGDPGERRNRSGGRPLKG